MSASRKKWGIIRILIGIFVIIHMGLSLFGCIDDYTIYFFRPGDMPEGGQILEKTVGNCGVLNLIIGAASLLFLFLNRRKFYITGFWLRLASGIVSFAEPGIQEFIDSSIMDGLARHEWQFTPQGYVAQVIALGLVVAFAGMAFLKSGEWK